MQIGRNSKIAGIIIRTLACFFTLWISIPCISFGQNVSGVINNFAAVTAINYSTPTLTVDDGSLFSPCQRVLLIQMQGATMDLTNTAAFGSITSYQDAGNYEFVMVQSVAGNTVTLGSPLQRTYTISGKVQLVTYPQLTNATISGALTTTAWNGTTGGVLVLEVPQTITLAADIDVSSLGFRGADAQSNYTWGCPHVPQQSYYPLNPGYLDAAPKGEGISIIPAANGYGLGAGANAGGGGENVNSGGGGGSNSGAGGFGGKDWDDLGGNTCNGSSGLGSRGRGGYALTYSNAANKIFMGGSGGAGHAGGNMSGYQMGYDTGGNGGHGGAIVILKANTITTSNATIRRINSRGQNAPSIYDSTWEDGQWTGGGGGGGGTVLLSAANFTSPGQIEVNTTGGNGGDCWWYAAEGITGPGGGGGGGALWISSATTPASIVYGPTNYAGGINGVWHDPNNVTTTDPWGATPGAAGSALYNLVITVPTSGSVITVNSPSICTGQSVTLTASGGTTYSWSTGATTNPLVVSPSTTTTYTVVGNTNGCMGTAVSTVTVGGSLNLTVNAPVICTGQSATLTATGGTDYSWSTGATDNPLIVSPSATTSYTVTGTTSGCSGTTTTTVTVGSSLSVTANSPAICNGQSATLTATGGTTYSWNTGSTANPLIVTPTTTTSYTVTGTTNGCSGNTVTTVTVNSTPVVTVNSSVICNGQTATLTATGGTTYSWSTGSAANPLIVTPTTTTSYTVTGTTSGCSASSVTTVTVNPIPTVMVSGGGTICSGTPAPAISFALTGTPSWTLVYSIDGVTQPAVSGITTSPYTIANPAAGTYSVVSITDAACNNTASGSVTVSVNTTPPAPTPLNNGPLCAATQLNLTSNTVSGATYNWTGPNGFTSQAQNPTVSTSATPAMSGTYSLTVTVGGCTSSPATTSVIINPVPNASAGSDVIITIGNSTVLTATGGGTYLWSNGSITNPITVSPSVSTDYCVTVTANNCSDIACVKVIVDIPCPTDFQVPNAFSPNNDGRNDRFCLRGWDLCITEFNASIYNRWGEKVFDSEDSEFCWDGTYGGKPLDAAVFVYSITAKLSNGEKISKKGNISLIR